MGDNERKERSASLASTSLDMSKDDTLSEVENPEGDEATA
jgi:hypothetical protein